MRERRLNALYVISGLLAWSSTYIEAVHEGKKPFKCTLCNQAWCNANFSKKGNLNVHIKSCNGQKHPTFQKCPLCPSIPFNLRKYIESTHDGFNSSNSALAHNKNIENSLTNGTFLKIDGMPVASILETFPGLPTEPLPIHEVDDFGPSSVVKTFPLPIQKLDVFESPLKIRQSKI